MNPPKGSTQKARDGPRNATRANTNGEYWLAMTIVADLGMIAVGVESDWVVGKLIGDTEYRKASQHQSPPSALGGSHWSYIYENHEVVQTRPEFQRFIRGGGHAFITRTLINSWLPEFLKPVKCRRHYAPMPWISVDHPSPFINDRFARRTLRQLVFSRDEDRCRICGRSTDDSIDIRLHAHHVLPHASGGMTNEHNLIVLCQECHDGTGELDQMRRSQLYDKIEIAFFMHHRSRHAEAVSEYRRLMKRLPSIPSLSMSVLPLEWGTPERRFEQRLVSRMISDNLVVRWFPVAQWLKLAKQVFV